MNDCDRRRGPGRRRRPTADAIPGGIAPQLSKQVRFIAWTSFFGAGHVEVAISKVATKALSVN